MPNKCLSTKFPAAATSLSHGSGLCDMAYAFHDYLFPAERSAWLTEISHMRAQISEASNGSRKTSLLASIPARALFVVAAAQATVHYSEGTLCVTIQQDRA
jgi:hypothetical protein